MAIENTYLLGKNITLGCGFDLQAKAPLDSRQTVPAFAGLQALINDNAAYEGMIVYDEETKKTYQAQMVDDVLAFREFGINESELKALIASETTAAMEFKGATTSLPENPSKGDMYKVTSKFEVDGEEVLVGDSIVYDGEQWFIIPSGDDIEDTWRPVTGVDNDSTLTFAAGDKLEKTVAADGTITYKHAEIDAPEDQTSEEDEKTRTYITQLITDNHGHIIGFKTATENVEDTNTEYTFEGQSDEATSVYFQVTSNEEGASAEVIYLDAYSKNEADGKFVAKETGKSLISDDEIARLTEVDNYDDEEVRGLIGDNAKAIEDLETYVGTIPTDEKYADVKNVISYVNKKAEETLAAAQGGSSETAASVKQQLDNYKSENDTRVKAVEDDIDAINNADTGILKQAKDYADGLAGNYDEKGAAAGVQTALEAEIAKKVTAVEGKDLIATSEIERLATLANYDDTQVKADIAKKADAETMTTELGKKVDKVDGKDLIATSEIERLATLKNYDDTALTRRVTTAQADIDDLEEAVALLNNNDNTAGSVANSIKVAIEALDATVSSAAIEDGKGLKVTVAETDGLLTSVALVGNFDNIYAAKSHNHTVSEVTDFDTAVKAYGYATKTEAQGYADAKDDAIAAAQKAGNDAMTIAKKRVEHIGAGDNSVTIGGTSTIPTVAAKLSADADNAITLAGDGLKVVIPASAEYSIVKAADSGDYAAVYNLTKDGTIVGASINIPKDMVVKSGSVVGDEIILVLNDEAATEIKIPVASLIEYVTSGSATGDMVVVNVSDDHKVTATITDGTITLAKLTTEVQTAINKAHVHDNKALLDTYAQTEADLADAVAKKHNHDNKSVLDGITAGKVEAWDGAATEAVHTNRAVLDGITAQNITDWNDAVAKEHEHENKTVLDGITASKVEAWDAAEQNAKDYADDLAGNYAEKATTYTKEEVDALLSAAQSWGEF